VLGVNDTKKYHWPSVIRMAERSEMEVYRQLINDVTGVYIGKNICYSSDTVLFFRVFMDVFLETFSCGSCVDIQHEIIFNILSDATRLDETYTELLL